MDRKELKKKRKKERKRKETVNKFSLSKCHGMIMIHGNGISPIINHQFTDKY